MVPLVRHPQTKERDTDRLHLNHRATSRLYPICDTYSSLSNSLTFFGRLWRASGGGKTEHSVLL